MTRTKTSRRDFIHRMSVLAAAAATAGGRAKAAGSDPAGGMRDLTSTQLAALMGVGWNLGNSLEAIGGETAWGNPRSTQVLFDAVKAAGFGTVRIPVAWKQHADADDTIRPAWLDRVAEVVGYARRAGLHAIVNTHWDGGWLQPTPARQAAGNAGLQRLWTQIATHFRDHDDTLLFAGTNEVMVEGDWGPPKPEYVRVQNGYNQVFVDTVRATGGNNAVRHLVVQGFNTNIDHTLAHAVLPRDSASARLMMEVHYYDPYGYALDEKSGLWQWGAGATDAKARDRWGDEAWVDRQFDRLKRAFVDRGVPVVVGEFGVIARPHIAGSEAYREAWNGYVARAALRRGMVPVYWDNGGTGRHGMGLFDRASGSQVYPGIIRALVGGGR